MQRMGVSGHTECFLLGTQEDLAVSGLDCFCTLPKLFHSGYRERVFTGLDTLWSPQKPRTSSFSNSACPGSLHLTASKALSQRIPLGQLV